MKIVLASKSPRRKEILELLGVDFDIQTADADESCDICEPSLLVRTLAARKGEALMAQRKGRGESNEGVLFIACDTLVFADGQILGKPRDRADAKRMLECLSGRSHEVYSGLYLSLDGKSVSAHASTEVIFSKMTESEIEKYLDSGEPFDKAGAYAVQGLAAVHIKGIKGDYFNVVGLPVNLLYETLKEEFGIVI